MAIDTANKRRSMISFARAWYGERVPDATGFDTSAERGQLMFLYAGLALLTSAASGIRVYTQRRRRRGQV